MTTTISRLEQAVATGTATALETDSLAEIKRLQTFITNARQQSELIHKGESSKIVVPYWFMHDTPEAQQTPSDNFFGQP